MKLKFLTCAVIATACMVALAKDPVLMKINGKDIHLSEFEYLYNKNSQQQVQKESLDDYLNRFVNYKLKVADAEAARIDTSAAFKAEFNGYKADIVKNYLVDTTVNQRLEREAYERMRTNVDVDHIMLPLGRDKAENEKLQARLDSIKKCVESGQSWNELAKKYSIDPSVKNNGGHYGYIASGMFPYVWEYTAYNTPVGQICKPFSTNFGNHLIRVNNRRDDPGQVLVEHILLLFPRNANDSAKAVVKQKSTQYILLSSREPTLRKWPRPNHRTLDRPRVVASCPGLVSTAWYRSLKKYPTRSTMARFLNPLRRPMATTL